VINIFALYILPISKILNLKLSANFVIILRWLQKYFVVIYNHIFTWNLYLFGINLCGNKLTFPMHSTVSTYIQVSTVEKPLKCTYYDCKVYCILLDLDCLEAAIFIISPVWLHGEHKQWSVTIILRWLIPRHVWLDDVYTNTLYYCNSIHLNQILQWDLQ